MRALEFARLETGRSSLSPNTAARRLPGRREGRSAISKGPLLHRVRERQELRAGFFPGYIADISLTQGS